MPPSVFIGIAFVVAVVVVAWVVLGALRYRRIQAMKRGSRDRTKDDDR